MATTIHAEDSKDYLSIDGLVTVSGVEKEYHIKLTVKEVIDNALDASERCTLGMIGNHGFYVQDQGAGIPGTNEDCSLHL